jgi:hypothetical protein
MNMLWRVLGLLEQRISTVIEIFLKERTSKSRRNLTHVLEMRTEVLAAGASSYMVWLFITSTFVQNKCTFFWIGSKGGSGVTNCMISLANHYQRLWEQYPPILKSQETKKSMMMSVGETNKVRISVTCHCD